MCMPWDIKKVLFLFSLSLLIRRACAKCTGLALKVQLIHFYSSPEHTETRQDEVRPKPHQ